MHPFQSQWLLGGDINQYKFCSHFSPDISVLPADSHCSPGPLSVPAVVSQVFLNTGPSQEYHRPRLVVQVGVRIVREAGVVFLQSEAVSAVIPRAGGGGRRNRGAVSGVKGVTLATLQS